MAAQSIQTAFNSGELSEHLRGRIDSEPYKRGLSFCENWMVLPQGPILKRAGTRKVGSEADVPRLIQFRLLGAEEDIILSLTPGHVKGWTRSGPLKALGANLALAANWQQIVATSLAIDNYAGQGMYASARYYNGAKGRIAIVTTPGNPYRIRFSGSLSYGSGPTSGVIRIGTTAGGSELWTKTYATHGTGYTSLSFSEDMTVTPPGAVLYLEIEATSPVGEFSLYAINVQNGATVVDLVSPWTAQQIPDVQFASEPAKNKMYLVHPNVAPQVITYAAPGTWTLAAAVFTAPPAAWAGANWPAAVELHQGRLLLGGTPNEPNTWWGSKSGALLDFTIGANPGDAYSWIVSTKGRIRWMQGQKALLIGTDVTEDSAVGSSAGAIITGQSVDIRDESAYGSAAIQGIHIGDQVVFASRDRKRVRALSYSLQDNAWISKALTFIAEHLTSSGIKEIHYARSPFSMLIVLLTTGEVRVCTYDRSEQVLAWWRLSTGAPVSSAAVSEGPDGSYLWIAPVRGGANLVEYAPLHEVGVVYTDSAVTGTVPGSGVIAGLNHLEGAAVRVLVNGAMLEDQVVAGGQVVVDAALVGLEYVVGLGYSAKAVTLPLNAKTGKVHNPKLGITLFDSALPMVNGKRPADRTPSTPMDGPEPRTSGKFEVGNLGSDSEGKLTIEQDLPFRTEVLSIYSVAQISEV